MLREQGNPDPNLIYTQLYEAFFTRSRWRSSAARSSRSRSSATQIWLFVAPGLYRSEKRALLPFLRRRRSCFPWRRAGLLFRVSLRLAVLRQLPRTTGGGGVPIELLPKVGEYLDLVMKLIFAFGLTFQLPVGLTLLAKVGITSSAALQPLSPLCVCWHVRRRRDAGTARHHHPDRARLCH